MSLSAAQVRRRVPPTRRTAALVLVVALGAVAAAIVAHLAAINPSATPSGAGAALSRAAYVLSPVAAGVYAWHRHPDERLGPVLLVFAAVAAIWTLNGASDPTLFGIARLVGIFAAPFYSYVLLSFPEGRLHSRAERLVVAGSSAVVLLLWVPLVLTTRQPRVATPLVECAPHCPRNVFFLGASPTLESLLSFCVRAGYSIMLVALIFLLARRLRSATVPMRRMLGPVLLAAIVYAASLAIYLVAQSTGGSVREVARWIVIVTVPSLPLALLVGIVREQMFIRSALQRLVPSLPEFRNDEEIRAAMAAAFKDDSLQIVYRGRAGDRYVDREGAPVSVPRGGAATTLQQGGRPVAAIFHDATLAKNSRFLRAIAEAAMAGIEKARLEAALRVSRRRLVHAADSAREQLEHNLHDGAQQQLVALRVRLNLAAEAIASGSGDVATMVTEIASDLETAVEELRRLAHGIYPALLAEHGLGEALSAAASQATLPTNVEARDIGRYDPDIEAAVYFCCVEALQNADKHAGAGASVTVRVWAEEDTLHFEVVDTGAGFEPDAALRGSGLTNMRDRIGAVGGRATISSVAGGGTAVSGAIPIP